MKFLCRIGLHDWKSGCKCSKCYEQRDKKHSWDRCQCTKCHTRRDGHKWSDDVCSICGTTKTAYMEKLCAMLKGEDARMACADLSGLGDPRAIPSLKECFERGDDMASPRAAMAIAEIGKAGEFEYFKSFIMRSSLVQGYFELPLTYAIKALGKTGHPDSLAFLSTLGDIQGVQHAKHAAKKHQMNQAPEQ